jgi:hypothetical protein
MLTDTSHAQGVDPFDVTQLDPAKCGAIDSSLWELTALTNHYDPTVARLARIFEQPIKQKLFDLEQFLQHSYESVCDCVRDLRGDSQCFASTLTLPIECNVLQEFLEQLKRKPKDGTPLAYDQPTTLFG